MPRKAKIIDRDLGWKALRKELKAAKRHKVIVGIYGQNASEIHSGSSLSNVQIGSVHEFGLGTSPERSFIRATVDSKIRAIQSMQKKLSLAILDRRSNTKRTLDLIGLFVKGLIQERISQGIPPPLKASTIARKGSSKPLIDTGQLRASIDHEVKLA